ncbi:dTMP kinase [Patescibacteria group bacterium]|nr:dTMP kinase [Patescibacteria group bacterium]
MKLNLYQGKFFVFEGLNGSGKSEQAGLLKEYFDKRDESALLTKEPTQWTVAGQKIKDALVGKISIAPLQLQELFAQDRAEHLCEIVIPALQRGAIVISDRYVFSSMAFGALSVPIRALFKLNENFICPNKVFLLRVSPEECLRRIAKRGTVIRIFEELKKMHRIRNNYERLAHFEPLENFFVVIDGEKGIEEIHQEIVSCLKLQ